MIHSVPARADAAGCETVEGAAAAALRAHVLGYGGFRSASGNAVPHRLLPISVAALIVDFAEEKAVVTGPRAVTTTDGPTRWGQGVTVGLTPAGVTALFGLPMRELVGQTLRLDELPGGPIADLPERLSGAADWPSRFRLLDDIVARCLGLPSTRPVPPAARRRGDVAGAPPGGRCGTAETGPTGSAGSAGRADGLAMAAWSSLQRADGRLRVGELAVELGVGRRGLEREFRAAFGLSPGAVGRIARFQRAVQLIGAGVGLAEVAADSGYADQPHLSRETRAMAGVTPGELRAFVQYRPMATA
ncbi:helix-turn-helix domain-containing protein [Actinoplanes sp. NPDC026619]|uniref:AraC family transcriptional regulator n=1 Tax=Actinoplanes sp. NPDC026619 TaxID=3155798 RepID=UPI0033E659BF